MSLPLSGSETAIWERLIHPEKGDLPPEAARFFLNLSFEAEDLNHMHELAVKGQQDELTPEEAEALRNYRQVGLQIDLLQSKARLAIQRHATS
ncbi:MAG TPA: hypothetical protein VIK18_01970 [Pirellulales bacterium]